MQKSNFSTLSSTGNNSSTHQRSVDELSPGIAASDYTARREAFFRALPDRCVAILPGAHRPTRTNDILWPFRQESNMWFLTGFNEPHAIAVFLKNSELNLQRFVLFCEETTAHSELWHGSRIGRKKAVEVYGASEAYERRSFIPQISQMYNTVFAPSKETSGLAIADVPLLYSSGVDTVVDAFISKWVAGGAGPATQTSVKPILNALKMCKSRPMRQMLQTSATITAAMFKAAMMYTSPGESEHSIQAVMDFVAQRNGASGFAYVPVVAGGKNALCLHYIANKGTLRANDLLMVDAGADYHYYPTDCTRAWPISGVFTEPQKELYAALLRVQKTLINRVTAGQRIREMQSISEQMLFEEMLRLGVISRQKSAEEQKTLLEVIYPHSWGHPMGIDIHEEFPASFTVFREGMMHTVEPGVYIPDDERFPERFRGIGFRIEDNVIVTPESESDVPNVPLVMTECVPKEMEELEEIVRNGEEKRTSDGLWNVRV